MTRIDIFIHLKFEIGTWYMKIEPRYLIVKFCYSIALNKEWKWLHTHIYSLYTRNGMICTACSCALVFVSHVAIKLQSPFTWIGPIRSKLVTIMLIKKTINKLTTLTGAHMYLCMHQIRPDTFNSIDKHTIVVVVINIVLIDLYIIFFLLHPSIHVTFMENIYGNLENNNNSGVS